MAVKQISVFVENRAGSLLDITTRLAERNINIRAVSLADTTRWHEADSGQSRRECEKAAGALRSITNACRPASGRAGDFAAVRVLTETA